MEQQLCVLACSAMGETGALIFALAVTVWGLVQRRAKKATDGVVVDLQAERAKLEAERAKLETEIKVLSVRPPPAFVIQAGVPIVAAPLTPPAPAPLEHEHEEQPDETLG